MSRFHIQSLIEVRDCEVAGVASRTSASAEDTAALARELGVGNSARAFGSVEELAADPSVDALWVCARNDTRLEVMEAIRLGNGRREVPLLGICLEKPLARTLQEALEVKAIADDIGVPTVHWRTEDGQELLTETSSSWCYVGAGLRHTFELLGPEYALDVNMAECGVKVFFSRNVHGSAGEDLVEKQNAEQGLMPISPNEPAHYGYSGENRHFVNAFLNDTAPALDFGDGVEVMRLFLAITHYGPCTISNHSAVR